MEKDDEIEVISEDDDMDEDSDDEVTEEVSDDEASGDTEVVNPEVEKWRRHFALMAAGKIRPNHNGHYIVEMYKSVGISGTKDRIRHAAGSRYRNG